MKRMIFIISILFLSGCSSFQAPVKNIDSRDFIFLIKDEKDFLVIQKNQQFIDDGAKRINDYWEIRSNKKVDVEIGIPDFSKGNSNCARTYGPYKIFALSPNLHRLKDREKINPYCFTLKESDLPFTILHEFVHTRHLLSIHPQMDIPLPWVWEGLAVYLSGEMSQPSFFKKVRTINICTEDFEKNDLYNFAPIVIAYLESKALGIGKELVKVRNREQLKLILDQKSISCVIKKEQL